MSLYRVRFTGRKIGAIGGFYTLPEVLTFGQDVEQATDNARVHMSRVYEHLFCAEVNKVEKFSDLVTRRVTHPETPAAKRGPR